jgi:plastocyanin
LPIIGFLRGWVDMRANRINVVAAVITLFCFSFVPGIRLIAPPAVAAGTISVSIKNFAFSPASVSAKPGDTVTWTNNDSVAHTVTATDGSFDTGAIDPGKSASITFSAAGTFAYRCSIHPSMTGSVKVIPTISLDKAKSKYNGTVKVALAGFAPNELITVTWPDSTRLLQVNADSSGHAAGSFRTPLSPLGTYTVTARDADGHSAKTTLRVIPRIMLAPSSTGPVGTQFRVYFYGFGAGDQVNIRWWVPDGTHFQILKTVSIASTGRASTLVNVPSGSAVGAHQISGNVVGISRSASTTYTVTPTVASRAETPTASVPPPTATAQPTGTPTELPTSTPLATNTTTPVATLSPTSTDTPALVATDTPTPAETATTEPTAPEIQDSDPATPEDTAAASSYIRVT